MSPRQTLAIALPVAALAIAIILFATLPRQQDLIVAQENSGNGSITILTISGGSLLSGATYSINPDPFTGSGTYTIQDNYSDDADPTAGMVVISGLKNGSYIVTQTQAPPGYERDKLSKSLEINDNPATATFSNVVANTNDNDELQVRDIVYTAKFECGTIPDNRGPLRPGHYDTDIGILNKQDFEVKLIWHVIASDGKSSNSILRTLEPQSSTGIVCKDLKKLLGGNDEFVEGFVLINVPVDSSLLGTLSGGTTVVGRQSGSIDILDVQVFYTANALDSLPHEVLVDKIVFTITGDPSGKIPTDMINKSLDVTVRSGLDEVSDPTAKVRQVLADQNGLSDEEAAALEIRIDDISVGAGTMIDDHALSLSRIPPQASG